MLPAAQEVAAEVAALLSFPKAATRVMQLLDDSESSTKDVGAALATDPALTARVLRIANSSLYATVGRVDTIDRAVTALGRQQLRDLTVGICAVRAFDGIPVEVVSMDEFWSHSMYCGILAEQLARRVRPALAGTAFTAGLLHDVGQLVLFTRRPQQARAALLMAAESGEEISMAEAESHVLGFDHAAVGLALGRQWQLPEPLLDAIAFHHAPSQSVGHQPLVGIVHLANALSFLVETEQTDLIAAVPVEPVVGSASLVRDGWEELVADVRERFAAVQTLLAA